MMAPGSLPNLFDSDFAANTKVTDLFAILLSNQVEMKLSMLSKSIFHIALAVFFLNAVTSYSACCFDSPKSDQVATMPCHQVDDNNDQSSNSDGCLLCISMVQIADSGRDNIRELQVTVIPGVTPIFSSGIDPPFRPPISYLS